jgi:ornithine cyclodeaminase/alanine dehydrogenase
MMNKSREEVLEHLNIGEEMLYLTKKECTNIGISIEGFIDLTENALIQHGNKRYDMPAKIGVHPSNNTFYHAMPAFVPSEEAVGVKWIASYPDNEKKYALPQITGLLILNDVLTGLPIALMDSTYITAMRTPAVSALTAAKLHPKAKSFGMFGCGVQGIEHVRFIQKTLKHLKEIYIYDINEEAMDNLISQVEISPKIKIIKGENVEEVARMCDVLCSATVILKEPLAVLKDEWIRDGKTILACDLNTFVDPRITHKADKYIVDSKASHQLLEKQGYFPDGLPNVYCETGEIIAGIKDGRACDSELIVCSNIGMAVCDMVVARKVFDIALERGVGMKLKL